MATLAVATVFAAWWWATVVSNDPGRRLGRLRSRCGPFGIILPDWRFFAPNPAQHDFELLFRVQTADDAISDWNYAFRLAHRKWSHSLLFPRRRREKAMFDLVSSLLNFMHLAPMDAIVNRAPYRILQSYVEHEVRDRFTPLPLGFQFAVVQSPGYDDGEPKYLIASHFVSFDNDAQPTKEARL